MIDKIINWYTQKKLEWLERKIKATKEKRNKKFENEIITATAIAWNNLKKYEQSLETKSDTVALITTKDGRKILVHENHLMFNEKDNA